MAALSDKQWRFKTEVAVHVLQDRFSDDLCSCRSVVPWCPGNFSCRRSTCMFSECGGDVARLLLGRPIEAREEGEKEGLGRRCRYLFRRLLAAAMDEGRGGEGVWRRV